MKDGSCGRFQDCVLPYTDKQSIVIGATALGLIGENLKRILYRKMKLQLTRFIVKCEATTKLACSGPRSLSDTSQKSFIASVNTNILPARNFN